MPDFDVLSVREALEVSLKNADHLGMKHAAGVAAARLLADRADELAQYGWVLDGKLDNVTVPTFVRALDSLGLTIPRSPLVKRGGGGGGSADVSPTPADAGSGSPGAKIVQMQQRVAGRRVR